MKFYLQSIGIGLAVASSGAGGKFAKFTPTIKCYQIDPRFLRLIVLDDSTMCTI